MKEFTFLELLEFILKDYFGYTIYTMSCNKCVIISNPNHIFKFYPQEYGFDGNSKSRELNNDEINKIRNKMFKILGIRGTSKIWAYYLYLDLAGNEISLNDIIEFLHSKKTKQCKKIFDIKNKIKKQLNDYILNKKYFQDEIPNFTEPVVIKMSFKTEISDISNHTFMFKILEDCLVENGLIKNDNNDWVKEIIIDKQDWFEGVVITIRDYKVFKHIVDWL